MALDPKHKELLENAGWFVAGVLIVLVFQFFTNAM